MKLSNWDQAAEYITRLRTLQSARDLAQYDTVTCTVAEQGSKNHYDIAKLTSVAEIRHAILVVLDEHIAECKRTLKTYGVDDDA